MFVIIGPILILLIMGLLYYYTTFCKHRCWEDEVLVLVGREHTDPDGVRRPWRVIDEGEVYRIPFVETLHRFSLSPVDSEVQFRVLLRGNQEARLVGQLQIRVDDHRPALNNAIERFLGRESQAMARVGAETVEGCIRNRLASVTPQTLDSDLEAVSQAVEEDLAPDLRKLGLVLESGVFRWMTTDLDEDGKERSGKFWISTGGAKPGKVEQEPPSDSAEPEPPWAERSDPRETSAAVDWPAPRDPEAWLVGEPEVPLLPAIKGPRESSFLDWLVGAQPGPSVPITGYLAVDSKGLGLSHTEAGRISWEDDFAWQISKYEEHEELAVRLGSGRRQIGFRTLAPSDYIRTLRVPEKKELYPFFVPPTEMEPLWNLIRWHREIANEPRLPPWPEERLLKRLQTHGPALSCSSCGSFQLEHESKDVYRCRACGYGGGDGLARLARRKELDSLRELSSEERTRKVAVLLDEVITSLNEASEILYDWSHTTDVNMLGSLKTRAYQQALEASAAISLAVELVEQPQARDLLAEASTELDGMATSADSLVREELVRLCERVKGVESLLQRPAGE